MTIKQKMLVVLHRFRAYVPLCKYCWSPTMGWHVPPDPGGPYACCDREGCRKKADDDDFAVNVMNEILGKIMAELRKLNLERE